MIENGWRKKMESKYLEPDYLKDLEEEVMKHHPIELWIIPIYIKAAVRVAINNGMTIEDVQKILDSLKEAN